MNMSPLRHDANMIADCDHTCGLKDAQGYPITIRNGMKDVLRSIKEIHKHYKEKDWLKTKVAGIDDVRVAILMMCIEELEQGEEKSEHEGHQGGTDQAQEEKADTAT